jgi:hypothetical protein
MLVASAFACSERAGRRGGGVLFSREAVAERFASPSVAARCPCGRVAAAPPQPLRSAQSVSLKCRWSLRRLCVVAMSRHSVRTADRPRLWNVVNPRVCLVVPKIGSISCARCL